MAEPTLFLGDCLFLMKGMDENSIDTIITDPPYGLRFMGKKWDYEVPSVEVFTEMLRIAKCGATLLCFGGTRTWHRIAVNIEDAGWEIRDTLMWLYGSGFPKSLNIALAIDKQSGAIGNRGKAFRTAGAGDREDIQDKNGVAGMAYTTPQTPEAQLWEGYGTALKPAFEPIIMAMKPNEGTFAENALKYGVAGLNIDGSRIGYQSEEDRNSAKPAGRITGGIQRFADQQTQRQDLGIQANVNLGRFPANLLLDDEVTTEEWSRFFYTAKASKSERNAGCEGLDNEKFTAGNYSQSPVCKTCDKTLNGSNDHSKCSGEVYYREMISKQTHNNHPTVKPLALMEYLCTLTKTPTGGIVLDPYMGSGTTGMACKKVGRPFIGIEISEEYLEIAKRRIEAVEVMVEELNPQTVMDLGI